jgi:hypothetical protein
MLIGGVNVAEPLLRESPAKDAVMPHLVDRPRAERHVPEGMIETAPWAFGRQFFAPGDTTIGNE